MQRDGAPTTSEKPTPDSSRKPAVGALPRTLLSGGAETAVSVFCRVRPLNERERGIADGSTARSEGHRLEYLDRQLVVHDEQRPRTFRLDGVFPPDTQQETVYGVVAKETVESVVRGYNGTIFAYGQTGSGKSHSMMGPPELVRQLRAGDVESDAKGITPRVVDHLFQLIKASPDTCDRFGDAPQWAHYGGYHYHDSHMLGFSQTHMAGAIACGCALCRVGAMLLYRCVPRLRPRPCG